MLADLLEVIKLRGQKIMSKKRVSYFDALNVVSCIAVVAMHVNGT